MHSAHSTDKAVHNQTEITKKNNGLKKQFFSFLGIKNPEISKNEKNEKNEKLNEMILKIKKSIESLNSEKGTLVLVTAQSSLNDVISLIKQKKACDNPQCCSRWSSQLEFELKEAYAKCNMAAFTSLTI
jgi:flagellar motility protein MotE (MotC chaperone)